MLELRKTEEYAKWLNNMRDIRARARVQARVERLAAGNPGDVSPVGEGVSDCALITGPVTGCISRNRGKPVSYC